MQFKIGSDISPPDLCTPLRACDRATWSDQKRCHVARLYSLMSMFRDQSICDPPRSNLTAQPAGEAPGWATREVTNWHWLSTLIGFVSYWARRAAKWPIHSLTRYNSQSTRPILSTKMDQGIEWSVCQIDAFGQVFFWSCQRVSTVNTPKWRQLPTCRHTTVCR